MRRPRFRIRTMMILIALIGLVGGSTLEYFRVREREKTRAALALHYDLSADRERRSADIIGLRIDYIIMCLKRAETRRRPKGRPQSESEQNPRESEEIIIRDYEEDPRPLVIEKIMATPWRGGRRKDSPILRGFTSFLLASFSASTAGVRPEIDRPAQRASRTVDRIISEPLCPRPFRHRRE